MTGWWVVSYLVLWVAVVLIALLVVGTLRQLGQIGLQLGTGSQQPLPELPSIENDGPAIGTAIPNVVADTINGFGLVETAAIRTTKWLLVMFLSPTCDTCQHAVELLNSLARQRGETIQIIVIMRADELACGSFQNVFPLQVPLICDSTRKLTYGFDVHRNPFGLLYDTSGKLVRKGTVLDGHYLAALLGEPAANERIRSEIVPVVTEPVPAPLAAG